MQAPFVSVVIPGYNCAQYIALTLKSVLSQNYPNFEVVFVDDGSTDDTRDAVAPFLDRIVYHHQANGGLAAARNSGMCLARGDFIAWLDADDLCCTDRLLVQAAYLVSHPRIVATGTNFAAFDDVGIFDPAHAVRYYSQIRDAGLGALFQTRAISGVSGSIGYPYLSLKPIESILVTYGVVSYLATSYTPRH